MNQFINQMELELTAQTAGNNRTPHSKRRAKPTGANWWFTQMRTVVNRAFDWSPAPAARAEQTYLKGGFARGIDLSRTAMREH
jgi:hypothetical protein